MRQQMAPRLPSRPQKIVPFPSPSAYSAQVKRSDPPPPSHFFPLLHPHTECKCFARRAPVRTVSPPPPSCCGPPGLPLIADGGPRASADGLRTVPTSKLAAQSARPQAAAARSPAAAMRVLELSPRGTSVTYASAAPSAAPAASALVRRASLKSMRVSGISSSSSSSRARPALVAAPRSTGSLSALSTASSSSSSASASVALLAVQPGKRRVRRRKSYSESGLYLDRMLGPPSSASGASTRSRPLSAGDAEDLARRARVVSISGFSQSAAGTWFFKVDVGSSAFDGYAVRRRFTDFKLLHEGLQRFRAALELPALPPHGFYSVLQIFVSPDKALAARARELQQLLEAINRHPVLSRAAVFADFLGTSPAAADGYVSLSSYEVPDAGGARFEPAERSGSSSFSHSSRFSTGF